MCKCVMEVWGNCHVVGYCSAGILQRDVGRSDERETLDVGRNDVTRCQSKQNQLIHFLNVCCRWRKVAGIYEDLNV